MSRIDSVIPKKISNDAQTLANQAVNMRVTKMSQFQQRGKYLSHLPSTSGMARRRWLRREDEETESWDNQRDAADSGIARTLQSIVVGQERSGAIEYAIIENPWTE